MTATPDSALRQALDALAPFADYAPSQWQTAFPDDMQVTQGSPMAKRQLTMGDLRRAREAHALITEALAQSRDKP